MSTLPDSSDVYATALAHYNFGRPLWHPEPDPTYGEVCLGDVGYIDHGQFCFLFNAVYPQRHRDKVPPDFTHLRLKKDAIREVRSAIMQPVLSSKSIHDIKAKAEVKINGEFVPVGTGLGWDFESSATSGAILALGGHAHRTRLECTWDIKKYIKKYISQWHTFAKTDRGIKLPNSEQGDIVFVYGFTKTTLWSAASFSQASDAMGATLAGTFTVPGVMSASTNLSFKKRDVQGSPAMLFNERHGPPNLAHSSQGPDWNQLRARRLESDQCIFLECFRVKRRLCFLKEIVAGAGPHELPPPHPPTTAPGVLSFDKEIISEQDYLDEQCGIVRSESCDRLDMLLDYMLVHSGADIVCASHTDLASLFHGRTMPNNMKSSLEELSPRLSVATTEYGLEGAYLSSIDLGKDEAHILEVSMGSDHTEGAAVESSDKQCACDTFQTTDGSIGCRPNSTSVPWTILRPSPLVM